MNTGDEREKMYIISRLILNPTMLATPNFEAMVTFAKETKGEPYEARIEKHKKLPLYYEAWDNWLELIYSLDSLHLDDEYDARFISKETIKRVDERVKQEWDNR